MTTIEQAPSPGIATRRVHNSQANGRADDMLIAAKMMADIRDEHENVEPERVVKSGIGEDVEFELYFR